MALRRNGALLKPPRLLPRRPRLLTTRHRVPQGLLSAFRRGAHLASRRFKVAARLRSLLGHLLKLLSTLLSRLARALRFPLALPPLALELAPLLFEPRDVRQSRIQLLAPRRQRRCILGVDLGETACLHLGCVGTSLLRGDLCRNLRKLGLELRELALSLRRCRLRRPSLFRSILIRLPHRLQRREGIRRSSLRREECAVLLEHLPERLRHLRDLGLEGREGLGWGVRGVERERQ
mmetsp:Transcript_23262/g.52782  ORF Transcript_23262/g.52782 Transcript_23262/m.52782 type:complete len:235 (+) Transcript_23262:367-1071(+)